MQAHDIDVDYNGDCDYPAYLLSLIAIPLLAVAMIIASLAAGCCRPRHGASESKRVIGIVCAVFSWYVV